MARPKGKRDDILNSASDVFNSKGFHLANINDIAEHAGIGKGTVYEYFASKNELFIEVVKHNTTLYIDFIREAISKGQGFRQKLNQLNRTHRTIIKENYEATGGFLSTPGSIAIALENREVVMTILLETREQIIEIISDIIKIGVCEGLVKDMPPEKNHYVADLIYDMINRNTLRICQFNLDESQICSEEAFIIDIILK